MGRDDQLLIDELVSALKEGRERFSARDGRIYDKSGLQLRLQELIPADIVVMRKCALASSIVVAAPHVSFDNWTQYFANRLAPDLNCGEVIARNFRDDDGGTIPVSIGRHIHVNRPTESKHRGGMEQESERALPVFREYVQALFTAGGASPIELLIELHGHHHHSSLEVATVGIDMVTAHEIKQAYLMAAEDYSDSPALLIEPLDKLKYQALRAKESGSLMPTVCKYALHIEIPRQCRENASGREQFRPLLAEWMRRAHDCLGIAA